MHRILYLGNHEKVTKFELNIRLHKNPPFIDSIIIV